MEKFQVSSFIAIDGIGAASGLVYHNDLLYIISDNSSFLYQYDLQKMQLDKINLVENAQENIIKKKKFDLESISFHENKLHIYGSGSTKKRNTKFLFDIKTSETFVENIEPLYEKVKEILNISDDELNIEGAFYFDNSLHLFQRGNGANSKNGIIIIGHSIDFIPIKLPKINNTEFTFTDAILVENKIFFLAAAEATDSTYNDGEILGSSIGCLDIATMEVEYTKQISNRHKFEGLTLYKKTATHIELLLCEDNDSDELKTVIYKLELRLQT